MVNLLSFKAIGRKYAQFFKAKFMQKEPVLMKLKDIGTIDMSNTISLSFAPIMENCKH